MVYFILKENSTSINQAETSKKCPLSHYLSLSQTSPTSNDLGALNSYCEITLELRQQEAILGARIPSACIFIHMRLQEFLALTTHQNFLLRNENAYSGHTGTEAHSRRNCKGKTSAQLTSLFTLPPHPHRTLLILLVTKRVEVFPHITQLSVIPAGCPTI